VIVELHDDTGKIGEIALSAAGRAVGLDDVAVVVRSPSRLWRGLHRDRDDAAARDLRRFGRSSYRSGPIAGSGVRVAFGAQVADELLDSAVDAVGVDRDLRVDGLLGD